MVKQNVAVLREDRGVFIGQILVRLRHKASELGTRLTAMMNFVAVRLFQPFPQRFAGKRRFLLQQIGHDGRAIFCEFDLELFTYGLFPPFYLRPFGQNAGHTNSLGTDTDQLLLKWRLPLTLISTSTRWWKVVRSLTVTHWASTLISISGRLTAY